MGKKRKRLTLPVVVLRLLAVLPENRRKYVVEVGGRERFSLYVSATGQSVRIYDRHGREWKPQDEGEII
jgi:hypothetical protein